MSYGRSDAEIGGDLDALTREVIALRGLLRALLGAGLITPSLRDELANARNGLGLYAHREEMARGTLCGIPFKQP